MIDKNDLYKNLGKIFVKTNVEKADDVPLTEDEYIPFINNASTIMIIPKTKGIKDFITQNFDYKEGKIPQFFKEDLDKRKPYCKSSFNCGYISDILNVIKNQEVMSITVGTDLPIKIETDLMIFYLAPRIEGV